MVEVNAAPGICVCDVEMYTLVSCRDFTLEQLLINSKTDQLKINLESSFLFFHRAGKFSSFAGRKPLKRIEGRFPVGAER